MKNNKSAFPQHSCENCQDPITGNFSGMTLREYYAGQALAGWTANQRNIGCFKPKDDAQWIVAIADALIAELEGGK